MRTRIHHLIFLCFLFISHTLVHAQTNYVSEEVAPGVFKIIFGSPEEYTPYSILQPEAMTEAMNQLPKASLPDYLKGIEITINQRGCKVDIPLSDDEQIYGFGMQINSFQQKHLKRRPIVNDILCTIWAIHTHLFPCIFQLMDMLF
ncbi:hypothetical protein [Carboxylicivirga caseinilyticus]|uniref:hypothetical protein n=1 Tax=Carboxylicivirga caseinilyticus TaxID=3417572 RepID=UPI003D33B758|nr:hypothetical protein [Marinilabiliaceae bacterium A049]